MPTLNPYANDPGYYIRAWTSSLGNINYKLKPDGWKIIDDWSGLPNDGTISWQQINALKSVGVVYTDDTGVIYPDDEKFQPDPEQVDSMDLSDADAMSFLNAILNNCELSPEQIADLYQMLGVEPPTDDVESRYSEAVESIEASLKSAISDHHIPLNKTLPLSSAESLFENPPSGESESHDKAGVSSFVIGGDEVDDENHGYTASADENTLGIVLVKANSNESEPRNFVLHFVFFDEDNITGWSVLSSQELTWDVRSELYGQISAMLQPVVEALSDSGTEVADEPTDFEISFTHENVRLSPNE